jgi:hypothetical protein
MIRWLRSNQFLTHAASAVALVILSASCLLIATPARSETTRVFAGYNPYVPGVGWTVPASPATWSEPALPFWTSHYQSLYLDNGDGVVSPSDCIVEEAIQATWQITKVSTLYCLYDAETALSDLPPIPPVTLPMTLNCVLPPGTQIQITDWQDRNLNGIIDNMDFVEVNHQVWREVSVECGVTVEWSPITPVRPLTWGRLKGLYK